MPSNIDNLFDHPLGQHKLTPLRKDEHAPSFRACLNEIGSLMAYEFTPACRCTT